ncbi:MAG TPA: glycosyltransferase [Thermoanaerobaculia bacterium]|jgi:glycosyltransferase involved in cell wall biosynthesis|nr:glycosyltransferase [Thermoanaerobaculia bacterium]
MIVARVIRDEGAVSALLRTVERVRESIESARFFSAKNAPIMNVAPGGTGARTGGVAIQLRARLRVERLHRAVLLGPRASGLGPRVHFEGAGAVSKAPYIVSVHDLTLLEERAFLESASALVFASNYLRDRYQLAGDVIEPGLSVAPAILPANGSAIAFAGAVQPHKGGHLLPEIARELAKRGKTLHVFGRGDGDLIRPLRALKNVKVHGYYPAGTLPSLLRRHGIGLVLVPSIVPEAFCLTISEAWSAGAAVAAFDLGAQGERIRKHRGGWLAPLDSGADGIVRIIDQRSPIAIPTNIPTAEDSARAYLALYRRLGWLG